MDAGLSSRESREHIKKAFAALMAEFKGQRVTAVRKFSEQVRCGAGCLAGHRWLTARVPCQARAFLDKRMRELLGVAVSNAARAAVPTIESYGRPHSKDKERPGGLHWCAAAAAVRLCRRVTNDGRAAQVHIQGNRDPPRRVHVADSRTD